MSTFLHILRRSGRGFTLLELLGVVAILMIFGTIVVTNVASSRAKARDLQRLHDLESIQSAVEMYYRDNGHYPISVCSNNFVFGTSNPTPWTGYEDVNYMNNFICSTANTAGTLTLAQTLAPYIPTPLKDPKNPGGDSGYLYQGNATGAQYCILIWRTPENMNNYPVSRVGMNRCTSIVNGKCTGTNSIYYGTGTWSTGC